MKINLLLLFLIFIICFSSIVFAEPVEITIEYGNETCTESWSCTDWSSCSGGTQTRTCTDANNCGTTVNKPAESRSCTVSLPSAPGSPGGPTISGDITPSSTTTSPEPEPDIQPEPETKESPYVQLKLSCVDEIEAGEPFIVNVTISSTIPIDTTVELLKKKQDIFLKASETKTLSFEVYAPEKEGSYNLVAVTPYATGNKTVNLIYKPMFLYVTSLENQTYEIHLKNFDNTSTTELQIVRDDTSTVYLDTLDGKIDYKVNITFSKPGEYVVEVKAMSGFDIIDEDIRTFKIEGTAEANYGLLVLIIVLIVILIGSILIFKELRR